MPSTFQLISSNVLSSSAASVTFSAIPSTYTDLVLRVSARSTFSGGPLASMYLTFNAVGGTAYSSTNLTGDGASAGSGRLSNQSTLSAPYNNAGTSTTNTFSSTEFYFPNYTSSAAKPVSIIGAQENNATTAYMNALAGLTTNTSVISTILIGDNSGASFASGSSFYLYGIKNS